MKWIAAVVAPLLVVGLLTSPVAAGRPAPVLLGAGGPQPAAASLVCVSAPGTEPVPAPTEPSWSAVRLGLVHAAGLSQGAGQLVAVLDTGVNTVPAIAGAVRPTIDLLPPVDGATPPADTVPPTDSAPAPAGGSIDGVDCDGRGTALAGLIAASRGPGAALPGVARAAEILPVRVAATANEPPEPAVLARGMDAAVAGGATVLLVAAAVRDDPALQTATQAALNAGVPVIAAAGDGDDQALAFPAGYEGVIAVSATGQRDDVRSVNAVGRVTVAAPGADLVGFGPTGEFVAGLGGSAFAAALVAGTAADLLASRSDFTPFDLRQRLIATADRPGVAVPDPSLGWGVINPVTALTAPVGDDEQPSVATRQASAPAVAPPVVVNLPPVPADNDWAVTVAVLLLVLAGGIAALVAGVRRAGRRRWRPAGLSSGITAANDSAEPIPDRSNH